MEATAADRVARITRERPSDPGAAAATCLAFVLLTATFFLLGIGNAEAQTSIVHIGGWVGLATAAGAWYASFSGVVK